MLGMMRDSSGQQTSKLGLVFTSIRYGLKSSSNIKSRPKTYKSQLWVAYFKVVKALVRVYFAPDSTEAIRSELLKLGQQITIKVDLLSLMVFI